MAYKKIGVTIALDGEKEFRAAVSAINASYKTMKSNVALVDSAFKGQRNTVAALVSRQNALGHSLDTLRQKNALYKAAVQNAQEQEAKAAARKAQLLQQFNQESQKLEMLKKLYGENSPAVKAQAERVEELRKELQQADKGMMSTAKSTAYWTDKLNKGEIELHDLEEEVEKTDKHLKEAQRSFNGTAKSIDEFGNEISEAKDKSSGFGNYLKANLLSSLITTSVSKMKYGFVEMTKSAVNAGANFEFAMSRVEALSGATDIQVQQLANKARTLGETTIYTAEQVADGLGKMALAGWTAEEMLEGIDGVVLMAASSEMELEEATSILADTLKAFGATASDSARYADVFAKVQSSTNLTTSQLGESLTKCATTAGTFNYSIEDVSTALGLMANAGYKGSKAGTALNTIMTRLATNTSGCRDELEALGVDVIDDVTGEMNDLGDVIVQLSSKMSTMSDAQASALAKMIAGQRGVAALNAIVGQGAEAYATLNEELINAAGSAKAMSSIMLDNLYGDTVILKSATESLKISFEKAFDSALRKSVQQTTGHINELNRELRSGAGVGRAVNEMAQAFDDASEDIIDFGMAITEGVVKTVAWVVNHRKPLVSALKMVAAAAATYKAMQIASNAATAANTVITNSNIFVRRLLAAAIYKDATAEEVEAIVGNKNITTKSLMRDANLSLLASELGLSAAVLAGAAALGTLAVAMISLAVNSSECNKASREYSDHIDDICDKTREQVQTTNDLNRSMNETASTIEAESDVALGLVDELSELQNSTEDTSVKQAEMQEKIDALNTIYPELGLAIDEETGELNENTEAIKANIKQYAKAKFISAYAKAMGDNTDQILANDVQLARLNRELSENEYQFEQATKAMNNEKTAADYNGASVTSLANEHENLLGAIIELEDANNELKGNTEDIQTAYQEYGKELGLTDSEMKNLMNSEEELAGVTSETAEEVQTAAGLLADAVAGAASKAVSSFDKIQESTVYSAEDLEEALNYNAEVVENWGNNLKTLVEWGIDEGLLQQLAEAGPEAASLAQAIVNMGDDKAREYSQKWVENVNAADAIADDLQAAVDRGKVIAEIGADDIAVTFADGQVSVIHSSKSVVESAAVDMVSGATEAVGSKWSTLPQITSTHFGSVATAISKSAVKTRNESDKMAKDSVNAAGNTMTVSAGSNIGMNLPIGTAQGIRNYSYRAANEATAMANQIIAAAKRALDSHSPSRKFYQIGTDTGKGWILGYQDSMKDVNGIINDSMQFSVSPTLRGLNGSTDAVSMIQQLGINLVRSVENMNNGLAENIVNAFVNAGIGIEVDGYNFGKLVRKEVAMA